MRNITPRGLNTFGLIVGASCILIGGYLIYSDFETLLKFIKLFLGFFLLLFGLGILGVNIRK